MTSNCLVFIGQKIKYELIVTIYRNGVDTSCVIIMATRVQYRIVEN